MSLRSKVVKLAEEHPEMRDDLVPLIRAARGPSIGDTVVLDQMVQGGQRGDQFTLLDTKEGFTTLGSKPFAPLWFVESQETGEQRWLWAWWFRGGPKMPKKHREPEDDALKAVLKALGPLKKELKRVTGTKRGTRTLKPKGTMAAQPVIDLLGRAFTSTGSTTFKIPVQTGADTFLDYVAKVVTFYPVRDDLVRISIERV